MVIIMKNKIIIKPAERRIDFEAAEKDYRYVEGYPIVIYFYDRKGEKTILRCLSEPRYFLESLEQLIRETHVEIPLDVIAENPKLIISKKTNLELNVILRLPPFIIAPWFGKEYGDIVKIRRYLPKLLSILQKMRGDVDERRFRRIDDKRYLEFIDKWINGEKRPLVKWTTKNDIGLKATVILEFNPFIATISFKDYIQTVKEFCESMYAAAYPKEKGEKWKINDKFEYYIKIAEEYVSKKHRT